MDSSTPAANMKARNIDLCVGRIIPDEYYVQGGGGTAVNWLFGYFDNVKFKPWTGFKGMIAETINSINQVPVEGLKKGLSLLDLLRDSIEEGKREDIMDEIFEDRRQKREQAEVDAEARRGGEWREVPRKRRRRQYSNETSIEKLNLSMMQITKAVLSALFPQELLSMQKNAISSAHGSDSSSQREGSPDFPENLTPDQSLMRQSEDNTEKIPVCSFEFKGPKLDLSSTQSVDLDENRSSRSTRGNGGQIRQPIPGNTQDVYESGCSAEEVAHQFNLLFANRNYMDENIAAYAPMRKAILPIAQSLSEAFLTTTGCAYLTNHQSGIAFYIDPESKDKAEVFVSGLLPCHRAPGNGVGMITLGRFCINKDKSDNGVNRRRDLKRLWKQIAADAYVFTGFELSSQEVWTPSNSQREEFDASQETPGQTQEDRKEREFDVLSHSGDEKVLDALWDRGISVAPGFYKLLLSARFQLDPVSPTCMESVMDGKLHSAVLDLNEELRKMFRGTVGVIGCDHSGVVLKSSAVGKEVAIKMWGDGGGKAVEDISREIKAYHHLMKKKPELLGTAVPKFLVGWNRPKVRSPFRYQWIMITEFVGAEVYRDKNGTLFVEDRNDYASRALSRDEENKVLEAARKSLKLLHGAGLAHRDVALRNLRVQLVEKGGVCEVLSAQQADQG